MPCAFIALVLLLLSVLSLSLSPISLCLCLSVRAQGEEEALFVEFRKHLKTLFDNIAQLVSRCDTLIQVYKC